MRFGFAWILASLVAYEIVMPKRASIKNLFSRLSDRLSSLSNTLDFIRIVIVNILILTVITWIVYLLFSPKANNRFVVNQVSLPDTLTENGWRADQLTRDVVSRSQHLVSQVKKSATTVYGDPLIPDVENPLKPIIVCSIAERPAFDLTKFINQALGDIESQVAADRVRLNLPDQTSSIDAQIRGLRRSLGLPVYTVDISVLHEPSGYVARIKADTPAGPFEKSKLIQASLGTPNTSPTFESVRDELTRLYLEVTSPPVAGMLFQKDILDEKTYQELDQLTEKYGRNLGILAEVRLLQLMALSLQNANADMQESKFSHSIKTLNMRRRANFASSAYREKPNAWQFALLYDAMASATHDRNIIEEFSLDPNAVDISTLTDPEARAVIELLSTLEYTADNNSCGADKTCLVEVFRESWNGYKSAHRDYYQRYAGTFLTYFYEQDHVDKAAFMSLLEEMNLSETAKLDWAINFIIFKLSDGDELFNEFNRLYKKLRESEGFTTNSPLHSQKCFLERSIVFLTRKAMSENSSFLSKDQWQSLNELLERNLDDRLGDNLEHKTYLQIINAPNQDKVSIAENYINQKKHNYATFLPNVMVLFLQQGNNELATELYEKTSPFVEQARINYFAALAQSGQIEKLVKICRERIDQCFAWGS